MEGNRFHDPGTPPPIDIELSRFRNDSSDSVSETIDQEFSKEQDVENKDLARTVSQMSRAIDIVESITQNERRRRPSRGGVLSNLLKLDLFDNRPQAAGPSRPPMPHLRSAATGRAFLHTLASKGSPGWETHARNSVMDDLDRAEMGTDAEIAAQRMRITAEIADILERQDFIIKLGKALIRAGAPSHRIEGAMEKTSKRLEIDASYIVLPGLIMASFGDAETHTSETLLIKCSRSLDICKLERVNDVAHKASTGELQVREATQLLDDIKNEPPTWGFWSVLLAYVGSSAFIAPLFFNGSWTDCWVSGLFGLGVGLLTFLSERVPMFANFFEMAVSVLVSVITIALHPHVCYTAVSLSAIVIALPGYSLTSAVMEISAKNIVSGSIHLIHAIMYVFFLGFGLGYGASIWSLIHPDETIELAATCANPVSPYWYFLLLPLAGVFIAIVFGAGVKQWVPFTLNTGVGFVVYYFLSIATKGNQNITCSAGAFALGLTGNLYGKITKNLAFVPLIGGIIILVPGSLGVRGVIPLFDGSDGASGGSFATQIIGIALSITLGLFLANLCVYPTGRKRALYLGF
ncbi:hypothetical protein CLU79DRAFT_739688 [Phycomyces nitens]|nr:hypothetical protein CLU79DRAFT_739688 [Phycomyces nitens]